MVTNPRYISQEAMAEILKESARIKERLQLKRIARQRSSLSVEDERFIKEISARIANDFADTVIEKGFDHAHNA